VRRLGIDRGRLNWGEEGGKVLVVGLGRAGSQGFVRGVVARLVPAIGDGGLGGHVGGRGGWGVVAGGRGLWGVAGDVGMRGPEVGGGKSWGLRDVG